MPQLFQALRCYQCRIFQVHQTKKSNKFECKLCGVKQSIKRHYGLGTAKDCRLHVQKLNGIRGEIDEVIGQCTENFDNEMQNETDNFHSNIEESQPKKSKWSEYVEKKIPIEDNSENMVLNNLKVVLDMPKKGIKTLGRKKNFNKVAKKLDKVNESLLIESNQYISNKSNVSKLETATKEINRVSTVDLKSDNTIFESKPLDHKLENNKLSGNCIPPKVISNSKWAQFIDIDDHEINNEKLPRTHNSTINPQEFFSLCNEDDLDYVLDI